MKKYLFLCLFSVFALSACETVIEIPLPEQEPRLVLNSILNLPWITDAYVSRSRSRIAQLEDSLLLVEDAVLSCYENDVFLGDGTFYLDIDTIWIDSVDFRIWMRSGYSLPFDSTRAGNTYRIEGAHPTLPDIRAETYLPNFVEPHSFELSPLIGRDEQGLPLGRLRLELEDPPGEENFFSVSTEIFYSHPDTLEDTLRFSLIPYSTDGTLREELEEYVDLEDLLGDPGSFSFFRNIETDQGREGQRFTLEQVVYLPIPGGQYFPFFEVGPNFDPSEPQVDYVIHGANFYVDSYSKDFYLYDTRLNAHIQNQTLNLSSLVGEPVLMHSNVENGYGIFGMSNTKIFQLMD